MSIETDYFLSFSPLTLWSQITKNIISKSVICPSAALENKHRKHSQKPIQNFTVQLAEFFYHVLLMLTKNLN